MMEVAPYGSETTLGAAAAGLLPCCWVVATVVMKAFWIDTAVEEGTLSSRVVPGVIILATCGPVPAVADGTGKVSCAEGPAPVVSAMGVAAAEVGEGRTVMAVRPAPACAAAGCNPAMRMAVCCVAVAG